MATLLEPTNGNKYVNAGESAVFTGTLYDTDNSPLNKASILSLTATLKDEDGAVINSRNAQSVLDANGGTLASDGTLTLVLSATDNAYQGTGNDTEYHYLQLTWTWSDGSNTLTGKEDWFIAVTPLPV